MVERLFFRDRAFLNQHFDVAVVARPSQQPALAHVVDPAVADMPPPAAVFLDQTDRTGCPRPKIHCEIRADLDDLVVCTRQRRIQKSLRVKQRQFRRHELILHGLQADFRCLRPVLVPAHAIEHQHDPRIVGYDNGGPILVILTITERGHFCVLDFHIVLLPTNTAGPRRAASLE